MKTKLLLLIMAIAAGTALIMTACSDKIDYYDNDDSVFDSPGPVITDTPPEPMEPTGPHLSIDEPNENNYTVEYETTVRYVGMIDANSIEVCIIEDDTIEVVRLSEESKSLLEENNICEGDTVKAVYSYDTNEQVVIKSLEVIDSE